MGMKTNQLSIITRPKKFREVFFQPVVEKEIIPRAISNKWPHAMLLKGSTGTGKTTVAYLIAMRINCENPSSDGEPCGECLSCKSIREERFDRDTLLLDGSMFSGKDDIVDFTRIVETSPLYDKNRVLIIEESDQLSTSAKNSLLKILEKPIPNTYFILLSMVHNAIPVAIQSRCQVFSFKSFNQKEILYSLKGVLEKINLWEDERIPKEFKLQGLLEISSYAKGSLREAIQLLEKCLVGKYFTVEEIRKNLNFYVSSSIYTLLMKMLQKDTSVLHDLGEMQDFMDFFNISYSALVSAYMYKITGTSKNEFYISDYKNYIAEKNFELLLKIYKDIVENSENYVKKFYFIHKLIDEYFNA